MEQAVQGPKPIVLRAVLLQDTRPALLGASLRAAVCSDVRHERQVDVARTVWMDHARQRQPPADGEHSVRFEPVYCSAGDAAALRRRRGGVGRKW